MKDRLTQLALLWLRVAVGVGLMYHGWLKLSGGVPAWADRAVEPLGFPMPLLFAWLAVASEVIGGFLLVIGLWTRLAAAVAGFTMGVAAFGAGAGRPFIAVPGPSKETSLAYLVILVFLLLTGPGTIAVDSGHGGKRASAPKKPKK